MFKSDSCRIPLWEQETLGSYFLMVKSDQVVTVDVHKTLNDWVEYNLCEG